MKKNPFEREIKVDFFRVEMPESSRQKFPDLVKTVGALPNDDSRNMNWNDAPIRLDSFKQKGSIWTGELTKIRMNELPPKVKLSGKKEDLDLDDDQGLGEETSFYYNARYNVLLLQRNRFGVSSAAFAYYFKEKSDLDDDLYLDPIIQGDAVKKLEQQEEIRNIEISFAGLDKLDIFNTESESVSSLTDISNHLKAPYITLNAGMGWCRGSMDRDNVLSLVKGLGKLLKPHRSQIKKINIKSKAQEGCNTEILDILEYLMVESVKVHMNIKRRVTFESREAALKEAWRLRKKEIQAMFDPVED